MICHYHFTGGTKRISLLVEVRNVIGGRLDLTRFFQAMVRNTEGFLFRVRVRKEMIVSGVITLVFLKRHSSLQQF